MDSLTKLVPVSRLMYPLKTRRFTIDDFTFRLHYIFTFSFLLIGSLLHTSERFFGKPIMCNSFSSENWCWFEGTFTMPKALMKIIGIDVIAPGIEMYREYLDDAKQHKDEVIKHSYYMWVSVVLFLQALSFYIPHWLWKKCGEKGRVKNIIGDLNKVVLEEDWKYDKNNLVDYLVRYNGKNNTYASFYVFCELLNLLNIILQMSLMNAFLGGEFYTYGIDVLLFLTSPLGIRLDPMSKVFPKMTKCHYYFFRSSGDLLKSDNLCMLPLNALNEKLFIFIWFWFYIVLIFSFISICYRMLVISWPGSRKFFFNSMGSNFANSEQAKTIVNFSNYSDWFLISLLNKNMNKLLYREMLYTLADRVQNPNPPLVPNEIRNIRNNDDGGIESDDFIVNSV